MILEQIRRKKLDRPHIVMPGDVIQLIISDDDGVRVIAAVAVQEKRIFDEAVMYDMKRGAAGRTGIGGFFLDAEED